MSNLLLVKKPGEINLQSIASVYTPQENEVKLKPLFAGICGSDVSVFKGNLSHAKYPVVPGHEVVAEVIDAGCNVQIETGTKVVLVPNSFCCECENCRKNRRNICLNKLSLGVNVDGVFVDEFCIDSKYILPIPEGISLERAVLTEPLAVIVHALKKVEINQNTSVAVIGCGTEGMLAIALATFYGAKVSAIDIQKEKLQNVKEHVPLVDTFLPNQVSSVKFDVVVECAGANKSVEQAFDIVKMGGHIILVGFASEATLPVTKIVRNEITIYGSIIYDFPVDFQKSLEILSNENFISDYIVSEIYPIRHYQKAYEDACSGKFGKILFDFNKQV